MKWNESVNKLLTEASSGIMPADEWEGTIYVKQLMDELKEDRSIIIIGVCGMSSVTLTIIATELCKRAIAENAFDAVVMAAVSERSVIKIQDDLAEQLGFPFQADKVIRIEERAKILGERLTSADGNKKTLVIFDDVCAPYNFSNFGIPVHVMSGCKIVYTSKSTQLCYEIGADRFVYISAFVDEATKWHVFKEKLGDWAGIANWNSIARQFVDECDDKCDDNLENIEKLAKEMNRWIASIKRSTQPSSPEHKPLSTSRFRQGRRA